MVFPLPSTSAPRETPSPFLVALLAADSRAAIRAAAADPVLRAQLEDRDGRGNTALWVALAHDDPLAVAALLKAGADPNARRADGLCPVAFAAWQGNDALLETLLRFGGQPGDGRVGGAGPLELCAQARQIGVFERLLAAKGVDLWEHRANGDDLVDHLAQTGLTAFSDALAQARHKERADAAQERARAWQQAFPGAGYAGPPPRL